MHHFQSNVNFKACSTDDLDSLVLRGTSVVKDKKSNHQSKIGRPTHQIRHHNSKSVCGNHVCHSETLLAEPKDVGNLQEAEPRRTNRACDVEVKIPDLDNLALGDVLIGGWSAVLAAHFRSHRENLTITILYEPSCSCSKCRY